jgi:serine/threonine protein kinase
MPVKREIVSELLIQDRPRRKEMKRIMSLHVGSRWYRAPEISLVEKSYDQASDMFSVGCIIYEMLMHIVYDRSLNNFNKDF